MSGVITVSNFGGGYGVTKDGGGTLEYSGTSANLYNGTTTINAGTLLLAKTDDVISANGSVIVGDTRRPPRCSSPGAISSGSAPT